MMPLRSLNNRDPAFVQFQNKTNRQVDVVWINYVGALQKYVTLKPRENINIDTYKTHPWIFVDPETGVKMRVGTRTVYYPFSNRGIRRWLGLGTEVNYRIPIPIRLPVFALREISLQTVMKLLKDIRHVDSLQLPSVLIRDIKQLHEEKDKILSSYVP